MTALSTSPPISRMERIDALRMAGEKCDACKGRGYISDNVKRLYDMWEHQHCDCFDCGGWGFHGIEIQMQITGLCIGSERAQRDLNAYRTYRNNELIEREREAREWVDQQLDLRASMEGKVNDPE